MTRSGSRPAPPRRKILVERDVGRLAELGYEDREDVEIAREDVFFRLPAELR